MSEILTEYLQRLEEQQESVIHLIKNQRQLLKEGKAAASLQGMKQTAAKVKLTASWTPASTALSVCGKLCACMHACLCGCLCAGFDSPQGPPKGLAH